MSHHDAAAPDRRKVRMGLALVTLIVLVAVVLAVVIDSAFARALMLAVAALGILRTFLLARSLRRG